MKHILWSLLVVCCTTFSFGQNKFTAYIFMAEECPVCNYLGKSLKKLSSDFAEQVDFVAVFPQRLSNIKTASEFKKKYQLTAFTVEIDHNRLITNKYNAAVTPEVVLVNNKDEILYQGRIDNSYAAPGRMRHGRVQEDLRLVIQKVLAGGKVSKPWPDPIGCYITKR